MTFRSSVKSREVVYCNVPCIMIDDPQIEQQIDFSLDLFLRSAQFRRSAEVMLSFYNTVDKKWLWMKSTDKVVFEKWKFSLIIDSRESLLSSPTNLRPLIAAIIHKCSATNHLPPPIVDNLNGTVQWPPFQFEVSHKII